MSDFKDDNGGGRGRPSQGAHGWEKFKLRFLALTKPKGEKRKLLARESFPAGRGGLASSNKVRGAEVEKVKPYRTF